MTTSAQVRNRLVEALQLDLIGPTSDDDKYATEKLTQAPSKWYLTGFLAPLGAKLEQKSDDSGDENLEQEVGNLSAEDNPIPENVTAKKVPFPSSMGLSFLLRDTVSDIKAQVCWGDYFVVDENVSLTSVEAENEIQIPPTLTKGGNLELNLSKGGDMESGDKDKTEAIADNQTNKKDLVLWQRKPNSVEITIPLSPDKQKQRINIPNSRGLKLFITNRPVHSASFPPGTRSISIFVVNYRDISLDEAIDCSFAFQTHLTLESKEGFIGRCDNRGENGNDWDEAVANLQYRHDYEFAVGHNVSAISFAQEDKCYKIATTWLPTAEVPRVAPFTPPDVELGMEAIASAPSAEAIKAMISPMVTAYEQWIAEQRQTPLVGQCQDVAHKLLNDAQRAGKRIEEGLNLLEAPDVLEAFQIANRAIALSRRQQLAQEQGKAPTEFDPPQWRPFQLAFILLNLKGMANPASADREVVDLLFFPTGGGKTEAYLGLAAFTIVLRRFRYPGIQSAGLTVLMRYTLRLLTLDQLERASRLICALEIERMKNIRLGKHPFEIGLWVGSAATPNKMGKKGDKDDYSARKKTLDFQRGKTQTSPIPLEKCPWCGEPFNPDSFALRPNPDQPQDLRVTCPSRRCTFRGDRCLPIVAVDETIYRRLPCFIIATVDKFANLPWVGQTGALFGKVTHYQENIGFFGPADGTRGGKPLSEPLPPPDLIIQDELHLISGPLGTMVGLYETAIDSLCTRELTEEEKNSLKINSGISETELEEKKIRPKIIASTATVRRAQKQIQALFDRPRVDIFPPPSSDRHDSFFAQTIFPDECNDQSSGRLYLGVAAQGRSPKVILLRVYLALLATAQKEWESAHEQGINPNPTDPYMTVLGYFNSLRELGGSRRIVEDEINPQLTNYGARRIRQGETVSPYFNNRKIDDQPEELTSRVSTDKVAETKNKLTSTFEITKGRKPPIYKKKNGVDVALATNMISVGLDIVRLGLMVVLGQPKSAAEYIQSTSRVGRDAKRPGLVVTLLNIHRPRDRSHYERFQSWHNSFYRAVEATSVTPFSPRALDRGLAGVMVALARLGIAEMTNPLGASQVNQHREELENIIKIISRRAEAHNPELSGQESETLRQELRGRINDLVDTWVSRADKEQRLQYDKNEVDSVSALLLSAFELKSEEAPLEQQKFKAQRSLRDVEPTVELWIKDSSTK